MSKQILSDSDFTYLSWNTFTSTRYALQYIAIPKAACTALKWWFAELENCLNDINAMSDSWETDPTLIVHDTLPQLSPGSARLGKAEFLALVQSEDTFRFSVVRNPYARIFSAWQSKLLMQEPRDVQQYFGMGFITKPVTALDIHSVREAFEKFLTTVRDRELFGNNWTNPHWTPQVLLLHNNLIHYNQIIHAETLSVFIPELQARIETYGGTIPQLGRYNESIIPYSSEYLTERSVNLIREIYSDDFELLGYDPCAIPEGTPISAEALRTALSAIPLITGRNARFFTVRSLLEKERADLLNTKDTLNAISRIDETLEKIFIKQQQEAQWFKEQWVKTQQEAQWFKEQWITIQHSRSWRITRPLRSFAGLIRQIRRSIIKDHYNGSHKINEQTSDTVCSNAGRQPRPTNWPKQASPGNGARILIVTPDIVGPIRNGGIGTAFAALALFAARNGFRVSILYTLGKFSEHWSIEDCTAYYARGGIDFIPMELPERSPQVDGSWPSRNAYRVYQWLKAHGENYDILIFPEWHAEAYYALLARHQGLILQNTKILVNTHGPSAWSMEGNYQLPADRDMVDLDFMEREVVRLADGIVSPSGYLLTWMRQHQWTVPSSALVIKNLIEEDSVVQKRESVALYTCEEIVFFGRLEPRKGLILFCDALDRLPNTAREKIQKITFLGKSVHTEDFDSYSYLRGRHAAWNMPIEIITDYDRDQALSYIMERPTRLAIIASLVENLPYTVLECLYHSIPFLSTQVGGIPELIATEDHNQVLFPPRAQALAKRLEIALTQGLPIPRLAQPLEDIQSQWLGLLKTMTHTTSVPAADEVETSTERPLVSICIPHHDSVETLRAALDSVYAQTYDNYEIIVVDDGSSKPQTLVALRTLENELRQRGHRLLRQDNAYPGAARNLAARQARGDYLLFMDDDNVAMPKELEIFVKAALKTNADILTCILSPFSDRKPPSQPERLWLPIGAAAGAGLFRNVFGDTNSFWKRSAFLEVGGFTEDYGVGHEDWELFAHALFSGLTLEVVPEPLFFYRETVDGIQASGNMRIYHARSTRPYLTLEPNSLGMALAYAVSLQLSCSHDHSRDIPRRGANLFRAISMGWRRRDLLVKFRLYAKRYGIKKAIKKALSYTTNK